MQVSGKANGVKLERLTVLNANKHSVNLLNVTADVIRQVAILVQPVMPTSSARLLDLLAVPAGSRGFASLGAAGRLAGGTTLPPPQPIFPRYVDEEAAGEAAPA